VLTRIHIENFKLHQETKLDAAPITVFIGPNNTGKSSIFQALLALRQAASKGSRLLFESARRQPTSEDQPYLFRESQILDIGEFKDAVRQGQDVIRLGMIGAVHQGNPFHPGLPIEVSFAMDVRDNSVSLHKGQIKCPPAEIEWIWSKARPDTRVSITVENSVLWFSAFDTFRLIGPSGYQPPAGIPVDTDELRRISESLAAAPVRLLNSLHPIYPLRGFEEWAYPQPVSPADNIEGLTLGDRALAMASKLVYDRKLERRLSERLEALLNIGIEVEPVPGRRVKIWAKSSAGKTPETLFVNEGMGANQLPFILVPIALAQRGESILLSEPEAHLHPKAQSQLTSLLLTVAKKENIQFFIETHSEHVLHRLLNAIAKGELERSQLAIYYFENVDGTAKVRPLAVNDKGQVDGGLPGFFDQSLTELTEYLDALRKP
jgi:predicted ATPase